MSNDVLQNYQQWIEQKDLTFFNSIYHSKHWFRKLFSLFIAEQYGHVCAKFTFKDYYKEIASITYKRLLVVGFYPNHVTITCQTNRRILK
jgi:peroxiredoxin